ncbi:MAG: septum formation initiator family protein [Alloprevotella sp.]|nr:septum formation initiator family protein [Alloprevotella sp.]
MGKRLSWIGRSIWRHKYFWTLLAFIVIVGFVDSNSLLERYRLHSANNALRAEIAQYDAQYQADTRALEELRSSQDAMEHVARVRLYMKTDNEDLYVIEEE